MVKDKNLADIFRRSENLTEVKERYLHLHPDKNWALRKDHYLYPHLLKQWRLENKNKIETLEQKIPNPNQDLPKIKVTTKQAQFDIYPLPHGGLRNGEDIGPILRFKIASAAERYVPRHNGVCLVEDLLGQVIDANTLIVSESDILAEIGLRRAVVSRLKKLTHKKLYYKVGHLHKALENPDYIRTGLKIYDLSYRLPSKFEFENKTQGSLDYVTAYAKCFADRMKKDVGEKGIPIAAGFVGFEHADLVVEYLKR